MSELQFIETNAQKVHETIISELENGVNDPLYPGDERRIFGDARPEVIVAVYNSVNDACKQKMLRYGSRLRAGRSGRKPGHSTPRSYLRHHNAALRYQRGHSVKYCYTVRIRVTNDFVHYFLTDATVVLYAGASMWRYRPRQKRRH